MFTDIFNECNNIMGRIINVKININDSNCLDGTAYEINKEKTVIYEIANKQYLNIKNDDISNEKINELQEELNNFKIKYAKLEKEKNNLEEIINNLKVELDNEIKKNNNNIKLDNEIKYNKIQNDLYKTIFEKDKEIKELKIKLSRFLPFELNEGEKLMVVNFRSIDQKLNYSIICKNTDIFNEIENKLYKDNEEYYETQNYFTVKGKKINKYKSLEWNKIKNNDIILLNILDI